MAVVAVVAILVVDDGMVLVVVAATARDVVFVALMLWHNNNYSICFLRHFELNETVQIGCQRGISRWNPFEACRPKIDEAVVAEVAILVVDDGMILVVVAITARDVVFVADAVVMDTEDKAAGESRSVNEVLYGRDMGFQHSTIERKILKLILKRYFMAEIEGPEQKSDSETEKDCRCCWILTSLHSKRIFWSYRSPIGALSTALESRHPGLSSNI
ncbi:uncharacterized protein LOC127741287 [Arachis duranensis]|uniref:Uncharacterized protein LOC127741287 n=1 Tax=Arachis duranensis TaxID=130453 RepID=A0A9C6TF63_ARADU|nr:uncharacterized protein LOC127741287 [Arachis duranensis]